MTSSSKSKGNCLERELVNQAKESGLESKRAYASDGRSLGHHEEVDLLVGTKRVQAKRRKSIAKFLKPTENMDAVAFREDRGDTLVLITWWEYLDLVKSMEQGAKVQKLLDAIDNCVGVCIDEELRKVNEAREALRGDE